MVKREDMFIRNLGGTLMWKDIPLFDFLIKDCQLVSYKRYSNSKQHYPYEMAVLGFTYRSFNEFLKKGWY